MIGDYSFIWHLDDFAEDSFLEIESAQSRSEPDRSSLNLHELEHVEG